MLKYAFWIGVSAALWSPSWALQEVEKPKTAADVRIHLKRALDKGDVPKIKQAIHFLARLGKTTEFREPGILEDLKDLIKYQHPQVKDPLPVQLLAIQALGDILDPAVMDFLFSLYLGDISNAAQPALRDAALRSIVKFPEVFSHQFYLDASAKLDPLSRLVLLETMDSRPHSYLSSEADAAIYSNVAHALDQGFFLEKQLRREPGGSLKVTQAIKPLMQDYVFYFVPDDLLKFSLMALDTQDKELRKLGLDYLSRICLWTSFYDPREEERIVDLCKTTILSTIEGVAAEEPPFENSKDILELLKKRPRPDFSLGSQVVESIQIDGTANLQESLHALNRELVDFGNVSSSAKDFVEGKPHFQDLQRELQALYDVAQYLNRRLDVISRALEDPTSYLTHATPWSIELGISRLGTEVENREWKAAYQTLNLIFDAIALLEIDPFKKVIFPLQEIYFELSERERTRSEEFDPARENFLIAVAWRLAKYRVPVMQSVYEYLRAQSIKSLAVNTPQSILNEMPLEWALSPLLQDWQAGLIDTRRARIFLVEMLDFAGRDANALYFEKHETDKLVVKQLLLKALEDFTLGPSNKEKGNSADHLSRFFSFLNTQGSTFIEPEELGSAVYGLLCANITNPLSPALWKETLEYIRAYGCRGGVPRLGAQLCETQIKPELIAWIRAQSDYKNRKEALDTAREAVLMIEGNHFSELLYDPSSYQEKEKSDADLPLHLTKVLAQARILQLLSMEAIRFNQLEEWKELFLNPSVPESQEDNAKDPEKTNLREPPPIENVISVADFLQKRVLEIRNEVDALVSRAQALEQRYR